MRALAWRLILQAALAARLQGDDPAVASRSAPPPSVLGPRPRQCSGGLNAGLRHGLLHDPDRGRRVVPAGRHRLQASSLLASGLQRPCPLRARTTGTQRLSGVASGLYDSGLYLRKWLVSVGPWNPGTRLENRYGVTPIVGSNPTPSAQPASRASSSMHSTRNSRAAPASSVFDSQPLRQRCGVRLLLSSHSRVPARNGMKNAPSAP